MSIIEHTHSNCIFSPFMTKEGLRMNKIIDGNALPTYSKVATVESGATDGAPQYFKYF